MAKKTKTKKSRNYAATDATLINVRKLKTRVTRLEDEVAILTSRVDAMTTAPEPPPDEAGNV